MESKLAGIGMFFYDGLIRARDISHVLVYGKTLRKYRMVRRCWRCSYRRG